MTTQTWVNRGILIVALFVGCGSILSHARQSPETKNGVEAGGSIGVVDMDKIYTVSGSPDLVLQKSLELDADAQQRLNSIASAPYLTDQERDEYVDLCSKFQMTDEQAVRLKAMRGLSDQRSAELIGLQSKKDTLSAEEQKKLREYIAQKRILDNLMPNISSAARMEKAERLESFRHDQIVKLREIVSQVAKQRGVAHVFDSNSLTYSTNDITELIIQKLNKRAK